MVDLADVLGDQHSEMRALLAALARQPPVSETITGPQLRDRRRVMLAIQHRFLAQTAVRLRHLWPALRRACPEGRTYASRAWARARVIEHRMVKREWCGERDEALNDLEAHIASDIEHHLALEEREVPRLAQGAGPTRLDGVALGAQLRERRLCPTRPHPDLPRSAHLAALVLGLLAVADHGLDRLGRPME